jgi:hypothetical protein
MTATGPLPRHSNVTRRFTGSNPQIWSSPTHLNGVPAFAHACEGKTNNPTRPKTGHWKRLMERSR